MNRLAFFSYNKDWSFFGIVFEPISVPCTNISIHKVLGPLCVFVDFLFSVDMPICTRHLDLCTRHAVH